ncbi:hypothetical protein A2U01_0073329, partial [Trifolium medium]|nr:hypothetical protein [Trifolium medium]
MIDPTARLETVNMVISF